LLRASFTATEVPEQPSLQPHKKKEDIPFLTKQIKKNLLRAIKLKK
jgi:hypothetical protein